MNLLFNCQSLSKSFGSRLLFQKLSFNIFENDRIGLIGPNGSGKSTLLNILSGKEGPDLGTLAPKKGLKIGHVPQVCHFEPLSPKNILIKTIPNEIPDYEKENRAETWLSKLGFTGHEPSADCLSGGWKKRLALAQTLILSPDLLLLDEPTNHLDLEGVLWLEQFLLKEASTYLLVSHDRRFLQQTANRIIEIDSVYPLGLFSVDGSYENFLEKKEDFLKGQKEQERSIAGKAKRELEWLRKSPKARTTKSQARVDQAYEIFDELSDLQKRNQKLHADISFVGTERETRKLLVATNISKKFEERTLFHHLDFILSPKTRMGLIGSNGSGKTTLLKLIAQEILPDQGTLKYADDLKIVYFDQHRMQLSNEISLRNALSPSGDYVNFRGQPVHVNGFCKRFLFSPDILDMPIGKLSGGEKARISIAHLMLQAADLLLLDEPTNDLDISTLQILEESLLDFPGAVVLITHDRYMLDKICNSVLVLESAEETKIYADYAQWEKNLKKIPTKERVPRKKEEIIKTPKAKLSYMEKQEFDNIESEILKKEEKIGFLHNLLENKDVQNNSLRLQEVCQMIASLEKDIETLYHRFDALEKKQK